MADRFLVWLSAGVLTAGVSAAMVAGAGAATADSGAGADTGDKAASESSNSADGKTDSVADSDANTKPDEADPVDPGDSDEGQADGEDDRPRNNRRSADAEPSRVHDDRTPAGLADDQVDASSESVDADDKEAIDRLVQQDPVQGDDNDTISVTPTALFKEPAKEAKTVAATEPGVVDTIVSGVSSVVGALLSPFAANTTPELPSAEPQLWTLAAASRREFETGVVSPSLAEQVAPVENSLTYTPGPNFQDQIVLMIHETLRVLRRVTGVDVHAVVGAALAIESPPFFLTFGLDTRRTVFTAEDGVQWQVWEFHPPNPTDKTVLAFHGGGNIYQPNILHWIDYTSMARETGATVIVPLYPLATTEAGRATVVIPEAADFISDEIDLHGAKNVSLYGDSAGSLIAMSAVRQLLLAGRPVPSSMVLVGMAAHYMSSNPDIYNIDDPLFDLDNLSAYDSHWLDGITDRRDPLITPLFFEPEVLKALPPTTLYVGTREILYPDTLLLHERAVEEGAPISVVVGTGLVHDWPLSGSSLLGYSQTAAVRPDVYRQLGITSDTTASLSLAETQEPEAISTEALAAAEEQTAAQPSLYNVIGSFAWGLFEGFSAAVAGQPQVPPGSTVRLERSTLDLDCGPGYTVDADWYFPDTDQPPTRLIYFQHGFPGSSVEYDYTAADLAERNNAIVVATTISSNLFDCYSCNLGGDPMHAAVGNLFIGEREELLASARAAGFEGEALPERFVLMGHSGGGQLVGGAAGYFEQFAPDDEDYNLAGVILLDTSPIGGAIERGLAKIPEDIPVYTISAAPNFLNSKGAMNQALVAARPDQFVGVELVNGAHSDAFLSHNPIVQIGGAIAGLGFSRPENVEAVQVISQGWINDWYEGTDTGVYGALGSTVDIPGTAGATAYVLPTEAPQRTIVDLIVDTALNSLTLIAYAPCAEDPSASPPSQTQNFTQLNTPNTALSLDGRASKGQSVGQHVCKG